MILRDVVKGDVPSLSVLASDTFIETFGALYTQEDVQAHLKDKCSEQYFIDAMAEGARVALVSDADTLVGYVKWGKVELPTAHSNGAREIHRLYVRATHQAQGIGAQLFEYAMHACAAAPEIYLGVWEHNTKAQRFYARYGFSHAAEYTYYVGAQADRDLIWRKAA